MVQGPKLLGLLKENQAKTCTAPSKTRHKAHKTYNTPEGHTPEHTRPGTRAPTQLPEYTLKTVVSIRAATSISTKLNDIEEERYVR